ncbi:DEAD/DEAH box helicase [Salisediminibacterium beveridgei]|uniref:RNA polymerase-associated protein rapA n=1 Tax=Salisediminibacterium beveridgei TaxID=632773 RepID=A0A1D7QWY5_9BACI|nr:SNF2-related protein [Salisediminibacterium beveridgei]AOM83522.1 RNA polymerase-associated protein rapA [Salisediminibacterium beveridgei]
MKDKVASFQKGDNVRQISTGKIGTVNEVLDKGNNIGYRVTFEGKTAVLQEKYLERIIDPEQEIYDDIAMQNLGDFEDYKIFNTWIRLKKPLEGNYYSYLSSKTIFNPFQFKPLIKFLHYQSSERILIADEVGVGKTIETGIILTELLARGRISRKDPVLIVCPNALGPKWQKEMKERFSLDFMLHDSRSLKTAFQNAMDGRFSDYEMFGIVSIQVMRNEDFLKTLEKFDEKKLESVWSLVIVDEAHHMRNLGTKSNSLGKLLSELSDMMIMLSATPLNLRDADFFQIMHILNPDTYPDHNSFEALLEPIKIINQTKHELLLNKTESYSRILDLIQELESMSIGDIVRSNKGVQSLKQQLLREEKIEVEDIVKYEKLLTSLNPLEKSYTRTLKKEAFEQKVVREVSKIPVDMTEDEKKFYNAVIALSEELFLAKGGNVAALGFVTNMPRRMAASCIPATKEYLEWSLDHNIYVTGVPVEQDEEELYEENFDDIGDDSSLHEAILTPALRDKYEELLEIAEAIGEEDSKYDQFKQYLSTLLSSLENKQVIVFSFFIRTLTYLEKRLSEDGFSVNVISGRTPLVNKNNVTGRYEIIDQFKNKEFQILLSSDVGGEGLDFQFCQAMINYDLPYNPMKVEQRIGRIDRFGQTAEKVFIASMYLADTVDERIYELLYQRINIVHDSIGAFEPILSRKLLDFQKDIITGSLSEEQIQNRSHEISISLEKSRLEYDHFEKQRNELLGEEEFQKLITGISEKNDFLNPSDAADLTKIFIDQYGGSYKELDKESGKLKLTDSIIGNLERFTRLPKSEGSINELDPLLHSKSAKTVIFNGSKANDSKHIFLPPAGFWMRFIIHTLENNNQIKRAFSYAIDYEDSFLEAGEYLIPIFEIAVEGIKSEHQLAVVPIDLNQEKVIPCNYIQSTREFSGRYSIIDVEWEFEQELLKELIDKGRIELEAFMNEHVENLRLENDTIVTAHIASLKKGSKGKIDNLLQMLKDHKDRNPGGLNENSKNYIKSLEARIENEAKRTSSRIDLLNEKKDISFSLSIAGVILLQVKEDLS